MVALLDAMGQPVEGMLRRVAVCDVDDEGEIVAAKTFFLRQATIADQEPAVRAALEFVNDREGRKRYRLAADVSKLYTREEAIAVLQQEAAELEEGKDGV